LGDLITSCIDLVSRKEEQKTSNHGVLSGTRKEEDQMGISMGSSVTVSTLITSNPKEKARLTEGAFS